MAYDGGIGQSEQRHCDIGNDTGNGYAPDVAVHKGETDLHGEEFHLLESVGGFTAVFLTQT